VLLYTTDRTRVSSTTMAMTNASTQ